ncbi:MAG: Dabb family protein [Mycobacterium sp.]|jgi:quinol monooxygenase YgiN
MPFTHVVTFKWRTDDFDADPIASALRELVAHLEGVQSYVCGSDVGHTPASYDFTVVGVFDSREHFTTYRDHPEHQRIIDDLINPNTDGRTVVQLHN